jgi:hypothetical protein
MKASEKRKFIRSFVGSIQKEALSKVAAMPEDWDGIELRVYLADKFGWEAQGGAVKRLMTRRRREDYRNAVYNNNL